MADPPAPRRGLGQLALGQLVAPRLYEHSPGSAPKANP